MTVATSEDVLVRVEGTLGRITLNRLRAINALTLEMVRTIDAALAAWESDPAIVTVLLDGAGDRGFCAGGDIRALYEAARRGDVMPRVFWREEYRLNARIARYPRPIVAIMHGITMGGGIGLAGHASHRVATTGLKLAMPEVGIGFAPDVGSTYLLTRAPGELGTHLALTGDRIGAVDAVVCGLADVVLEAQHVDRLVEALRERDVDVALGALPRAGDDLDDPQLRRARTWIDACYAADTVEEILDRLRGRDEPAAVAAAAAIESKSPTSLRVTLRALRSARDLPTVEACLDQEYRISCAFLDTPDFTEGIRAQVIDKDGRPRWRPASDQQVADAEVDRHFATLGADELGLAA